MPKVLVVDDSGVDRHLAQRILSEDPTLTIDTAENGLSALARLKEAPFDLVLTDLQMPDVNGLQLVTTIRVDFPNIPVILMTGQGSEVIAVEALDQGASGYVPKRKLNEWLLDTVQNTLAIAQADRTYQDLIGSFNWTAFNLSIKNDVSLMEPLVEYFQQIVVGMGICDSTDGYRVGVALREALLNALYRGNLQISREEMQEESERLLTGAGTSLVQQRQSEPPYCDRQIHVSCRIGRDEVQVIVRDEGPGFDVSSIPASRDASVIETSAGRGLVLMRSFMDDVMFNEAGNEVTLIKRRDTKT